MGDTPDPRVSTPPTAPRKPRWAGALAVLALAVVCAAVVATSWKARQAGPVDIDAKLAEMDSRNAQLLDRARRGEPDPDGRALLLADLRDLQRIAPDHVGVAELHDTVLLRELQSLLHGALQDGADPSPLLADVAGLPERRPGWVDAHVLHGQLHLTLGGREPARVAFTRATELRPDDAALHGLIGALWMNAGHGQEAAGAYADAVALRPDRLEAWLTLGLAHASVEGWDEAVAAYARGAEVDPVEPRLVAAWAEAESRLGRHDRAAQLWSAAIRWGEARGAEPDALWAYRLAQARGVLRRGDVDSAWTLLEGLPVEARALSSAGGLAEQIAEAQGDPARALRYYADVVARRPGDPKLLREAERYARSVGESQPADRYARMLHRLGVDG
ncbi:MAG: hypothetical protein AAGA57_07590 [Planctomycetota bacterium]